MAFEFASATPQDREAIQALLLKVFEMPPDSQFVDPALMQWKFFQPRPDWSGARSYRLRKDDRLVAHACAFPVTFLAPAGPVRADHMADWAADKADPGAGVLVWRHLSDLTPVMLTVGGSQVTRKILPGMRYRTVHTWDVYARVVRPWKQFRTDPFPRGWKQPLRILRNTAWSLSSTAGHTSWSARRIESFDNSIQPLLEPTGSFPFCRVFRSPELLNYFLSCPAATFSAYLLTSGEKLRGWFLLSRIAHQSRVADIWVHSAEPADWRSAYSVAVKTAASDPECCEITAAASTDLARQAISANGFQFRQAEPVFLYDPKRLLEGLTLQLEMVDGDAAFLTDPSYPFMT